jgi:hypothetical protein
LAGLLLVARLPKQTTSSSNQHHKKSKSILYFQPVKIPNHLPDKKGFCALFGVESLRRKFSGGLKMSHFATLSAQIYWALAEMPQTDFLYKP